MLPLQVSQSVNLTGQGFGGFLSSANFALGLMAQLGVCPDTCHQTSLNCVEKKFFFGLRIAVEQLT